MSSYPYINFSNVFNPNDFLAVDSSLTIAAADQRYVRIGSAGYLSSLSTIGNVDAASFSLSGASIDLSAISGVTAGIAAASKALIVDSSRDITNINALTATGKITINSTVGGTMFSSIAGTSTIDLVHSLNGTALLGSTTSSAFGFRTAGVERVRILSNGNVGISTSSAAYKLDVNGDINTNVALRINRITDGRVFDSTNGSSNMVIYHFNNGDSYLGTTTSNNLVFQTQNTARMTIDSLGAISGISSLSTTSLIVNGISVSSSDLAYLSGITPGTVTASKAVVVDSNKDIAGLGTIRSNSIAITPTNYTLTVPNIPGCLWRTDSTRLCAFREIDSNNWSWGYSGGGVWNDILVMSNSTYRMSINGDLNYTGSLRSAGTILLDSSRNLTVNDITAAYISAANITATTSIVSPIAHIRDNFQTSGTRVEYLSLGRSSSGSDHGSWSFMNYYQTTTQSDGNYFTLGPRLRTGLTTGWGMCMTQNGNVSFQDKNANAGAGGFKIQANIVGTVDIQGGITRTVGAGHGYLQANSGSPAAYNASSVSTRIGLWVENSIWCGSTVYSSSDIRLKRDIEPIPLDEAKKLLNVQAVSYRWKKDTEDNMPEIGCIAQDLLEAGLAPLVSFCPNNDKENFPEGYQLGLQYSRLPIYMLELIKDLYEKTNMQQKEINRLSSIVDIISQSPSLKKLLQN